MGERPTGSERRCQPAARSPTRLRLFLRTSGEPRSGRSTGPRHTSTGEAGFPGRQDAISGSGIVLFWAGGGVAGRSVARCQLWRGGFAALRTSLPGLARGFSAAQSRAASAGLRVAGRSEPLCQRKNRGIPEMRFSPRPPRGRNDLIWASVGRRGCAATRRSRRGRVSGPSGAESSVVGGVSGHAAGRRSAGSGPASPPPPG